MIREERLKRSLLITVVVPRTRFASETNSYLSSCCSLCVRRSPEHAPPGLARNPRAVVVSRTLPGMHARTFASPGSVTMCFFFQFFSSDPEMCQLTLNGSVLFACHSSAQELGRNDATSSCSIYHPKLQAFP
eukprot:2740052-Rhodomonas_salina.2